jgi:hypothetical protein
MTDETLVSAAPIAAPKNSTPTAPIADTAPSVPATTSEVPADDFDENIIPEASRENFRKFRESQKAKATEYEKKLNDETRKRMEFEAKWNDIEARQRAAQSQPRNVGPKPDYRNYSTIEEYTDAYDKWKEQDAISKYQGTLTQQQQAQKIQEENAKLAAKGNAARSKYPDFDKVVGPILPIANQIPVMGHFIREYENGTDVLYHLGQNPAALEALSKLQPFAAGQELLRIQAALSTSAPKAISKAPEPFNPVNTGGDGNVKSVLELVKKDKIDDFVDRENRKELRRRKGSE